MKSEGQRDEEAPVERTGPAGRWRKLVASAVLHVIDPMAHMLSRLRNLVEPPPSDGEKSTPDRGKHTPHADHAAAPAAIEPHHPRHLVQFFAFSMVLVIGTILGAGASYLLLSKAHSSSSAQIERLRDELADSKKQESSCRKELASRKKTIDSYDQGAVKFLKEIEDCKAERDELHGQLEAARSARGQQSSRDVRGSRMAAGTTATSRPQKTGTCVTDPANVAASLEKCVEEFNRR